MSESIDQGNKPESGPNMGEAREIFDRLNKRMLEGDDLGAELYDALARKAQEIKNLFGDAALASPSYLMISFGGHQEYKPLEESPEIYGRILESLKELEKEYLQNN